MASTTDLIVNLRAVFDKESLRASLAAALRELADEIEAAGEEPRETP